METVVLCLANSNLITPPALPVCEPQKELCLGYWLLGVSPRLSGSVTCSVIGVSPAPARPSKAKRGAGMDKRKGAIGPLSYWDQLARLKARSGPTESTPEPQAAAADDPEAKQMAAIMRRRRRG